MSVAHLTQRLSHVLTISNLLGSKGLVLLLYQSVSLASIMLLSRQGSSYHRWPLLIDMLQIPSFAIGRVRMNDIRKEMMREVKG
jgi:hypothetical protein